MAGNNPDDSQNYVTASSNTNSQWQSSNSVIPQTHVLASEDSKGNYEQYSMPDLKGSHEQYSQPQSVLSSGKKHYSSGPVLTSSREKFSKSYGSGLGLRNQFPESDSSKGSYEQFPKLVSKTRFKQFSNVDIISASEEGYSSGSLMGGHRHHSSFPHDSKESYEKYSKINTNRGMGTGMGMGGGYDQQPAPSLAAAHGQYSNSNTGSKGGFKSKLGNFRPSPQLLTDPQSSPSFKAYNSKEEEEKKLSSPFQVAEAKNPPRYESGFQPISYHQYASGFGTTATRDQYTNSHKQYFNPWSASRNPAGTVPTTKSPPRQDRRIVNGAVSRSVVTTESSIEESRSTESQEESSVTSTTSSSERIEDWIKPNSRKELTSSTTNPKQRFPVYKKKVTSPENNKRPMRIRPVKCEKFHRYGFCPVTSHYPL